MDIDARMNKLPKWAQDELLTLRRLRDQYKEERDALCSKEPTRVMWGWEFQDRAFGYLPEGEEIAFQMKGDYRHRIRIRLLRDYSELHVSAECGLVTIHEATNCFRVKYKPDDWK